MDPINNDAEQEGIVIPSISADQPLPGQPEPSSEPQPDVNNDVEKTVPLAALHEERTKRQELQAEIEILKQIAGDNVLFDMNGRPVPNAARGHNNVSQQQQAPNQAGQELDKLWESDPRKAVQVEIMAAMSWRDNMETQVDNQIASAEAKYSDFKDYQGVIRQYVRALPLEQRSQPGVIDLAYYVVKGQNSSSAVERAKAEMLQKIQAGNAVQGLHQGTKAAPQIQRGVQLNDEQLRVAEAMNLTPEQYISAMKK